MGLLSLLRNKLNPAGGQPVDDSDQSQEQGGGLARLLASAARGYASGVQSGIPEAGFASGLSGGLEAAQQYAQAKRAQANMIDFEIAPGVKRKVTPEQFVTLSKALKGKKQLIGTQGTDVLFYDEGTGEISRTPIGDGTVTKPGVPKPTPAPGGKKRPIGTQGSDVIFYNDTTGEITKQSVGPTPIAKIGDEFSTGIKQTEKDAETKKTFNLYETARDGLLSGLGGSLTGPVVGKAPAVTAKQQVAEGSVAAMAPVLKQLFRVAGEGTFTDRDQQLLLNMVPTRKTKPEAIKPQIELIDSIVKAKLGMKTNAPQKNSAATDAPQPAGNEVERSVNGRVAIFDGDTKQFIRWQDGRP